ncbi:hypothetical protein [Nocardia harenae]|uniref:hypothetical protein n=1 Tax=Nocardia harenae TaxID=358707 RepID=UPI00147204AE|nr:hypothetical protein [Nocardia harenae]
MTSGFFAVAASSPATADKPVSSLSIVAMPTGAAMFPAIVVHRAAVRIGAVRNR